MARFYARFDNGNVTVLDQDGFDKRTMSDGTNKRNGLIASRSILSADVYEDLDPINIDGTRGTYFPPDLLTVPNNPFSATAYTSSVPGIVIPADYRTRPTGSILSTQTSLVGQTDPLDTVSVSYTSYVSASAAVRAVLDSISSGGPYARAGLNPSRTLHSVWHDQDLQYFAWDDFTPGTASFSAVFEPTAEGAIYITSSTQISADISWFGTFSADNLGQNDISVTLAFQNDNFVITSSNFVFNGVVTTNWSITPTSLFNVTRASGPDPVPLALTASAKFYDVTIPTHQGQPTTQSLASVVFALRLVTIDNNSIYVATGSGASCYLITRPVYTTFLLGGGFPGDNPTAGTHPTNEITKIYSDITPGPVAPTGFEPDSGELPGHNSGATYWLIHASNTGTPTINDKICEYQDGVRTVTACVDASVCYSSPTPPPPPPTPSPTPEE